MATKKKFDFALEQEVELVDSGERGTIIGRAHYVDHNPAYLIRYKAGDGRLVESWWHESAIVAPVTDSADE